MFYYVEFSSSKIISQIPKVTLNQYFEISIQFLGQQNIKLINLFFNYSRKWQDSIVKDEKSTNLLCCYKFQVAIQTAWQTNSMSLKH